MRRRQEVRPCRRWPARPAAEAVGVATRVAFGNALPPGLYARFPAGGGGGVDGQRRVAPDLELGQAGLAAFACVNTARSFCTSPAREADHVRPAAGRRSPASAAAPGSASTPCRPSIRGRTSPAGDDLLAVVEEVELDRVQPCASCRSRSATQSDRVGRAFARPAVRRVAVIPVVAIDQLRQRRARVEYDAVTRG